MSKSLTDTETFYANIERELLAIVFGCEVPHILVWNKPITLQCDASLKGLGACIIQEGQLIAFMSKSLTDTETCYANIERELLAIVFGCEVPHILVWKDICC